MTFLVEAQNLEELFENYNGDCGDDCYFDCDFCKCDTYF